MHSLVSCPGVGVSYSWVSVNMNIKTLKIIFSWRFSANRLFSL